jgi:restriction endonuclease Mrr
MSRVKSASSRPGSPAAFALTSRTPRNRVGRLHRTSDVPQADRLTTVRQFVAAIRDGIDHGDSLLDLLSLDRRHFHYYRQAAKILGLLEFTAKGRMQVTPGGERLLAAVEESREERQVYTEAIKSARALRPFSAFFAGEAVEPAELARRLMTLSGLSQSTAERRAHTLFRWRSYILGPDADAARGLVLADVATKIRKLVDLHNARARQDTLEWLLQIDPTRLEKLVAELLRAMGYTDVEHRGGPLDGGVDVRCFHSAPVGPASRIAVQVKRYSTPVARPCIDELLGVLHRDRYDRGIVVTTSAFTPQAREVALGQPIELIGGLMLVDLLVRHQVILKQGVHGELRIA